MWELPMFVGLLMVTSCAAKSCDCHCDCAPSVEISECAKCDDSHAPTPKPTHPGTKIGGPGPRVINPAYAKGNNKCPAPGGPRVVKLVNNCQDDRWFKMDGLTTPLWATRPPCPWSNINCVLNSTSDPLGIQDCRKKLSDNLGLTPAETGVVYCRNAKCACNPFFLIKSGDATEITIPNSVDWPSATGWLATGCSKYGAGCYLGDTAHLNSLFEFTYDKPLGQGNVYYDISAVNSWTTISPVGMKSCGGNKSADPFWCEGTGCNFDVNSQCPDGTASFPPGPGPDGNSANSVPTGTVFNAGTKESWTWNGPPQAFQGWGTPQGLRANRRYTCTKDVCTLPAAGTKANTCMGGCDLCTRTGAAPSGDDCIKYCCPDITKKYSGFPYRFDSEGCLALGVQNGTNYSPSLKGACHFVYTYGYEDHTSTFQCYNTVDLMVMACPKESDFPPTRS